MPRLLYRCKALDCRNTVAIDTGDPQEVGRVLCDCTTEMELEKTEQR